MVPHTSACTVVTGVARLGFSGRYVLWRDLISWRLIGLTLIDYLISWDQFTRLEQTFGEFVKYVF